MKSLSLAALLAALVSLAGCNCPMCGKASGPGPVVRDDAVAPAHPEAPATAPAGAAQKRILGLEEGWELVPGGASYAASQTSGEVILKANGEHPTGGYETKLVMSPLRIYPPQWMLAQKKPGGVATQAFTPFEVTASFKADEKIEAVRVSDAAGTHTVVVEPARD